LLKDRVYQALLRQFPYEPTSGQRELLALLSDFLSERKARRAFVLRGYAGTGKTTVVAALVKVLPGMGKQAVLLAPTGRAAKVLTAYSGKKASTIHKKIYRLKTASDGRFSLSLMSNPHTNTVFIVDEASMVPDQGDSGDSLFFSGRSLLEDLISFVFTDDTNSLMLLGDTAQLPPVGSVRSPALEPDYLASQFKLSVRQLELTEVMRQAQESGILTNATLVREKISTANPVAPYFTLAGFGDILRIQPAEVEELLQSFFTGKQPEDAVVITRSNKRAGQFNRGIRSRILYREEELSAGDYLMVVRNNYFWLPEESAAGFIANGDIIEVLRIRETTEIYGFRFARATIRMIDYPDEDELDVLLMLETLTSESASLPRADHDRLFNAIMNDYTEIASKRKRLEKVRNNRYYNALQVKFAYALTCHKTQGGQWKQVLVDQGWLPDEPPDTEYLRWLYTAVTRSCEKLYLLGFKEEFFG